MPHTPPPETQDLCFLAIFYGLYYGCVLRDFAEYCAETMASNFGVCLPSAVGLPMRGIPDFVGERERAVGASGWRITDDTLPVCLSVGNAAVMPARPITNQADDVMVVPALSSAGAVRPPNPTPPCCTPQHYNKEGLPAKRLEANACCVCSDALDTALDRTLNLACSHQYVILCLAFGCVNASYLSNKQSRGFSRFSPYF
jgi:hypothetical protein